MNGAPISKRTVTAIATVVAIVVCSIERYLPALLAAAHAALTR